MNDNKQVLTAFACLLGLDIGEGQDLPQDLVPKQYYMKMLPLLLWR